MKEVQCNHYKIKLIKHVFFCLQGLKNYMAMEAGQIWTGKRNTVLTAIQSLEIIWN